MISDLLRTRQVLIAISLIAVFAFATACGSSSSEPVASGDDPTAEAEQPATSPTHLPEVAQNATQLATPPTVDDSTGESWSQVGVPVETSSPDSMPEPTEPALVNTPVPVSNIAPDFTLPSVQGPEYTLSQFRGEKPVAVVFYRAYW